MIKSECAICDKAISGYPSVLVAGTTTWLADDRSSGSTHLHQPRVTA